MLDPSDLDPNSPSDMRDFVSSILDGPGWFCAEVVPTGPLFASAQTGGGSISLEITFARPDIVNTTFPCAIVHFPSGEIVVPPKQASEILPFVVSDLGQRWNDGGYLLIAETTNGRPSTAADFVSVESIIAHANGWKPPDVGSAVVSKAADVAGKAVGITSGILLIALAIVAFIYLSPGAPAPKS